MKTILAILALTASLSAVAGPEEHEQAQKCYVLSALDAKRATDLVPEQICLETIKVDLATDTIDVYSYFFNDLFKNMKLNSLIRQSEDFYSFKSSNTFYNSENEQSGQIERLTVLLSGKVDFNGYGDPAELNVEVKQERRYTPHSSTNSTVYQYVLQ